MIKKIISLFYFLLKKHAWLPFLLISILFFEFLINIRHPVMTESRRSCWVIMINKNEQDVPISATVIESIWLQHYSPENPNYTFLVPKNYEAEVLKQINKKGCCVEGKPYGESSEGFSFEIEWASSEQQYIKLTYYYDDGAKTSWYRAYDKRVVPSHEKSYFGPGITLFMFVLMLPLFLLVRWILLIVLGRILS